ncbi:hypothetical protein [Streptomyces tsukubensis]|uniref:Uncharacterized protein n=1 Tax=Streptomyces tsukubensis TaxID=83656 RepID=A0A1V4A1J0_9ACTN|nr:hypothetical protein [Streptomyces tsukubensis]OON72299.1 hypothetical protein B1H18_29970 [Streptomyces tsukubensis]QFR94205.1 hypothetical protein GBW32_15515 [Streptomyces tsukubensis]
MTTTDRHLAATERVQAAEEAVVRLRTGLADAGIKLPSLRLDPASCAGAEPTPLVDLGRCNLEVVAKLSALVEARHPS